MTINELFKLNSYSLHLKEEAEAILKKLPLEFDVLLLRLGQAQWQMLCAKV